MREQQRIFFAVVACLAILLGWQYLFAPQQQRRGAVSSDGASTGVPRGAGDAVVGAPERAPVAQPDFSKSAALAAVESAAGAGEARGAEPELISFTTPLFKGELSSRNSAVTALQLLQYSEAVSKDEPAQPVSLVARQPDFADGQAQVLWDIDGKAAPVLRLAQRQAGEMVLVGADDRSRVAVTVEPQASNYALAYTLGFDNLSSQEVPLQVTVRLALSRREGASGGFLAPPGDQLSGLCSVRGQGVERHPEAGLAKAGPWQSEAAEWAALDRQYFVVALVPGSPPGQVGRCDMRTAEKLLMLDYTFATARVAPGKRWQQTFTLYLGPKKDVQLRSVAPALQDVIDYNIWHVPLGFLARPMVFLLNLFHSWTASWGVAIMLLTLVVKLLLFPVTYKSVLSMRKMQLLKPELERIKKQFANERERQQMEQLKLFREKGVNPLGGCLPMLLQMPVWFALYRTLWTAVDLYHQKFLWIADLTAKEPFPFLALVLGVLTFAQQKLTPMAVDNQQAKMMMYVMPVMLTVFMIALPSGLVLYILVNSVLTIIQQLAINRRQVTL